ncbi:hypothetical protein F5883DRAFT_687053, partial [Diaporthe sp. PMI_573]
MEDDPLLTTLVVNQYRKLTRGRRGTKKALEQAKQADENSLERIILKQNQGDTVWRAFYAAKKATQLKHGFTGQAKLAQLLNELSAQPIEAQRAFAEQLAAAMESGDQTLVESSTLPPVQSNGVSDRRNGAKRRRTHSPISLDHYVSEQASSNTASLKDVYVGAPLEPAKDLFHDQFWDSIERIPSKEHPDTWLADISIFFHRGHTREHFGCQMEIGITPEKVTEYALEYFNVKVEVKDGVRYVRYPGGAIIEPDTSVKLRVCTRDFSRIFKGELYEAHRTSPIYQSEEKKKLSHSDGVSMSISNQAKEGGKMTVFMGIWRAVRIKEKFYG